MYKVCRTWLSPVLKQFNYLVWVWLTSPAIFGTVWGRDYVTHFFCVFHKPIACSCCSVTKSCLTLANPWIAPWQASLSFIISWSLLNSCPLSWWCHPTISSSVALFSCPQSFPASVSFPMSWLFASGGQSIGASASLSVFLMNIQSWCPLQLLLLSHFSHVWLLATPWTAGYQAPPSMGFSRQQYWSWVLLPSPSLRTRGRYNIRSGLKVVEARVSWESRRRVLPLKHHNENSE